MGRPDAGEGGGMIESYEDFIARKQNIAPPVGFDPGDIVYSPFAGIGSEL